MNRDDVIKKEFPHAFIGYDVAEVDLFLDEVIREFDRLHNEIDVLTFRLDELMSELGKGQDKRLKDQGAMDMDEAMPVSIDALETERADKDTDTQNNSHNHNNDITN